MSSSSDHAGDAGDDDSGSEDTSPKFVDTAITNAQLRRDDEHWRPMGLEERAMWAPLLASQISIFAKWPHYAASRESVSAFARRFMGQPEGYSWTLDFSPALFCELAYEGFLSTGCEFPVGGGPEEPPLQVMLPWIDPQRNSLDFHEMHVSQQVRKHARRYTISTDAAFDDVLLYCIRQHGEGWLYRGVRWLMRRLFARGYEGKQKGLNAGIHSFELWDKDGRLVAGDLGYTVGGVYTSMTGFRLEDTKGAGNVQLALSAALLHRMGYRWWDLGMVMKYKGKLGARTITREAFMERYRLDRDLPLKFGVEGRVDGQGLLTELRQLIASSKKEPNEGGAGAGAGGDGSGDVAVADSASESKG